MQKQHLNTLTDWLIHIEKLHPVWMDLSLERVLQIAKKLNVLKPACPVITVGGTNGKGSVVTTLAAIYHQAGYRVGSYTSPHLIQFNERIRIQQQIVSDADLVSAFQQIEITRADVSLTYFEFATLAALLIFAKANLDVIILEVGLGGRLDATNIIDADIAVITTIALDHEEWLGNTRDIIAIEKAGIIKSGKLAVCGDFKMPKTIADCAKKLKVPLYRQAYEFGFSVQGQTWTWWNQQQQLPNLPMTNLALQNIATALQAVFLLQKALKVSEKTIKTALQTISMAGRFQQVQYNNIEIILDVAHNPASAELLASNLRHSLTNGKTIAVFAALTDKDIDAIIDALLDQITVWCIADLSTIKRGSKAHKIVEKLEALGIEQVGIFKDVENAWQGALQIATPQDRIVVFGSFHTVAPVLAILQKSDSYV